MRSTRTVQMPELIVIVRLLKEHTIPETKEAKIVAAKCYDPIKHILYIWFFCVHNYLDHLL